MEKESSVILEEKPSDLLRCQAHEQRQGLEKNEQRQIILEIFFLCCSQWFPSYRSMIFFR